MNNTEKFFKEDMTANTEFYGVIETPQGSEGFPAGIFRFDEFYGTVIKTTRSGAYISLRSPDGRPLPTGFSFCSAEVGDRVLVSVRRFDRGNLIVAIDSIYETNRRTAAA